jgi:hypothetical protein
VSSETGWDNLSFYLNGQLHQRWNGDVGWNTHLFTVPAGTNLLEWRYSKDFSVSAGLDAAFLDNIDLPLAVPALASTPGLLAVSHQVNGAVNLQVTGQPNRNYVIQASNDLENWASISTNRSDSGTIYIVDPEAGGHPVRFYRAVVP